MAKRNSQLTELLIVAQDDYLTIVDTSAGQSKRVSVKNLTGAPNFGWQATGEAWTFSSWNATSKIGVVTVPTDATTKYSEGMRVRFSQTTGGTKYGYIIALTSTTLSLMFLGSAVLANEAISTPVYSTLYQPYSGSLDYTRVTSPQIFATTGLTLSFVVPFDCVIEAEAHVQATWGFAGGTSVLSVNTPAGLTALIDIQNTISGGDTVPKTMLAKKVLTGAVAGQSLTITAAQTNSGTGGTTRLTAKCIPA